MQAIEVVARWGADGRVTVTQVTADGKVYPVEATGRQWTDEAGLHVLALAPGGRSFELVFDPKVMKWFLRERGGAAPTVV